MPLRIEVPTEEIARYCRENGIARLRAFGSVLRDDFGPDSDVDLLVSEKGISKYIRDKVFAEAEVLYVSPHRSRPSGSRRARPEKLSSTPDHVRDEADNPCKTL